MDVRAAQQHREDAHFRVFMMLIALVLMTIRARSDARSVSPSLTHRLLHASVPGYRPTTSVAQLHVLPFQTAVAALFAAAELAARRLISTMRADYELMKLAPARPLAQSKPQAGDRSHPDSKRLDSS